MAIIGNLPVTLTNGSTADASQVMSNLNYIVNQVNAGAVPVSELTDLPPITTSGLTAAGIVVSNSNGSYSGALSFVGVGGYSPSMRANGVADHLEWVGSNQTLIASLDESGNFTATGNITANSDERLKKDWKPLGADFIEKLAGVLSGTFTRTDTDARQAGVGAQSLREVLPEAVADGDVLSVAYGQAALVACVELAKEVIRLRALLEPLK